MICQGRGGVRGRWLCGDECRSSNEALSLVSRFHALTLRIRDNHN